jgi:hypothetical protein
MIVSRAHSRSEVATEATENPEKAQMRWASRTDGRVHCQAKITVISVPLVAKEILLKNGLQSFMSV